ncbi:DNA alkylation repair protein [Capnocytophaga sp.]|uniref:DNA alkylation repair protein n=1 Tax=Capnocytophaga sp. TaxID=44737 RepID=UPI0026DB7EF8|nr:DNA alkylation repair protein [Capnocytophaga sp.]MDO5106451.1 DNA alkylation repair protein [Capnocytophaga sp.]
MNFTAILQTLEAHKNEAKSLAMSAYMKNNFPFLGIQSPLRRELVKPFLVAMKKENSVDWHFIEQCWACAYREMQYVALDYLASKKRFLTPADVPRLKQLAEEKSWWDSIDCLDRIIGSIALRFPEVNEILLQWSASPNKWLRRIAIDHQLLRKNLTNTDLLEKILLNNLSQTEFFINKAIGWALRDYSKTNPQWVRAFIETNESKMASLSIKEASKYLT